jgi:predicted PurR-regulated permease PerM
MTSDSALKEISTVFKVFLSCLTLIYSDTEISDLGTNFHSLIPNFFKSKSGSFSKNFKNSLKIFFKKLKKKSVVLFIRNCSSSEP